MAISFSITLVWFHVLQSIFAFWSIYTCSIEILFHTWKVLENGNHAISMRDFNFSCQSGQETSLHSARKASKTFCTWTSTGWSKKQKWTVKCCLWSYNQIVWHLGNVYMKIASVKYDMIIFFMHIVEINWLCICIFHQRSISNTISIWCNYISQATSSYCKACLLAIIFLKSWEDCHH